MIKPRDIRRYQVSYHDPYNDKLLLETMSPRPDDLSEIRKEILFYKEELPKIRGLKLGIRRPYAVIKLLF